MNTFWLSTISTFLSSFALASSAAEQVDVTAGQSLAASPVASTALFETALGLIFILALIFVLAWLIKRTGKFQSTVNGEIKMIAGLSLGTRERVVLLEVGNERILVGVTPQQIQTLHILNQQGAAKDSDKYAQFDEQLQSIIKKEQAND